MATAPVKSPLHNFPSILLKWGGSGSSSKTQHPHNRNTRRPNSTPSTPERHPPSSEERENPNPPPPQSDDGDCEGENNKTWNLRPRRPTVAQPAVQTSMKGGPSQPVTAIEERENQPKSMRLRDGTEGERREKRRFWIALSKDEIEEDIYAMTGSKPSRRPKRRPKNVQKQLDNVFPGLWLVGLTPDNYRSLDVPPKR